VTFRYQKANKRPESRTLLQASASKTQAFTAYFSIVYVKKTIVQSKLRIIPVKTAEGSGVFAVMKALWVLKFRSGHDQVF
jgi:hypothetical protein